MNTVKRLALFAMIVGGPYWFYSSGHETAAIFGISAFLALTSLRLDEELDKIRAALKLHAKRVFPEYGDD